MPKRVIDFDAMWGSDKLAACEEWAQAEYAWLYGLADACGSFELTNLRVIWGRVAAIRKNLTIERLEQVFQEFHENGLMFVWMHEGKRYAHWTGSDVPGRLPAPSWRMRLEKFAPPVPKERLAEYMARFARGRAALGAGGFLRSTGEPARLQENLKFEISELKGERAAGAARSGLGASFAGGEVAGENGCKAGVEGTQGQDLNLDWNLDLNLKGNLDGNLDLGVKEIGNPKKGAWETGTVGNLIRGMGLVGEPGRASNSPEATLSKQTIQFELNSESKSDSKANSNFTSNSNSNSKSNSNCNFNSGSKSPDKIKSNSEIGSAARSVDASEPENNSQSSERFNSHLKLERASRFESGVESQQQNKSSSTSCSNGYFYARGMTAKEVATEKELRVGQGPVCGPKGVRPEVLERVRQRDAAARAGGGKGK